MKKIGLSIALLSLLVTSCDSAKRASNQAANQAEKSLRGDWVLESVKPAGAGNTVIVNSLFNKASLACFEGSEWHLVANNSSGYYVLDGSRCPAGEHKINWHMSNEDGVTYFWFKDLNGEKAKNVKAGYKMQVLSITENEAHLVQDVPLDGGKTTLHYQFVKK